MNRVATGTADRGSGLFPSLRRFLLHTIVLAAVLCGPASVLQALAAPPPPQAPEQAEHVEVWTGSILSATFRVGMCTRPDGALRGVFLLTHKSGETDVYHIYGHATDTTFEASHASGHTFWGDLSDPGTVRGKMRIKRGMRFSFEGKRHYNARVSEDCTPLP